MTCPYPNIDPDKSKEDFMKAVHERDERYKDEVCRTFHRDLSDEEIDLRFGLLIKFLKENRCASLKERIPKR